MREQLTKYVELLFAGAPQARDIQQEILQNTLDRYDDLIVQGKSPEAAYSLSIAGIGDINELLGQNAATAPAPSIKEAPEDTVQQMEHKKQRAVAIALYILCPIPLFALSECGQDTLGLCMMLILVAAATALIIMAGKEKPSEPEEPYANSQPTDPVQLKQRNNIRTIIRCVGVATYIGLSFFTQAWFITWLVFPLMACVRGLIFAIMDMREADRNEN